MPGLRFISSVALLSAAVLHTTEAKGKKGNKYGTDKYNDKYGGGKSEIPDGYVAVGHGGAIKYTGGGGKYNTNSKSKSKSSKGKKNKKNKGGKGPTTTLPGYNPPAGPGYTAPTGPYTALTPRQLLLELQEVQMVLPLMLTRLRRRLTRLRRRLTRLQLTPHRLIKLLPRMVKKLLPQMVKKPTSLLHAHQPSMRLTRMERNTLRMLIKQVLHARSKPLSCHCSRRLWPSSFCYSKQPVNNIIVFHINNSSYPKVCTRLEMNW